MNMQELIIKLRQATVKLYLIKKAKKGLFEAYRLPNGIDDDVKEKYCSNLAHFTEGRTFSVYDFVHKEKNSLVELETNKVERWSVLKDSLITADRDNMLLNGSTFNDDYNIIIVDFGYRENETIEHVYLISKYMKTETWYKKGLKFAFTANGLVEKREDIIVLSGCIDVVLTKEKIVVLNEKNFEDIFNYYETAKKLIEDSKPEIAEWDIMTETEVFFTKVFSGKTRVLKLANALKNSKTDWKSIPNERVKEVLNTDDRFSSIQFDENSKVICTDKNVDLIIDIIREVYSKQLFTGEIIETKGV